MTNPSRLLGRTTRMRNLMTKRFLVVAALALPLVLMACGDDDDSSSAAGDSTTSTTAGPYDSGGSSTTAASSTGAKTIAISDGHLVTSDGMSVYFFEKDNGMTSACKEACAQAWPAVVASGTPTVGDGLDASKVTTANGQVANQVAYNGHLLYTFSGDKNPGDTNGKSIPSWYLLDKSGEEIEGGSS